MRKLNFGSRFYYVLLVIVVAILTTVVISIVINAVSKSQKGFTKIWEENITVRVEFPKTVSEDLKKKSEEVIKRLTGEIDNALEHDDMEYLEDLNWALAQATTEKLRKEKELETFSIPKPSKGD